MDDVPRGIKGVTDRARIPRKGRVSLGRVVEGTRKDGSTYTRPESSEFFVFDDIRELYEIFGDECVSLPIAFPMNDIDAVWDTAYKWYGASGLHCRGNGEIAMRKGEDGWESIECPGEECEHYLAEGRKECRRSGTLTFIIAHPDVDVMEAYYLTTTSFRTIQNINYVLNYLKEALGRIHFIPLELIVNMENVPYTDKDGKQRTSNVPVASLKTNLNFDKLRSLTGGYAFVPEKQLEDKEVRAIEPIPDERPADLYPEEEAEAVDVPDEGRAVELPDEAEKPIESEPKDRLEGFNAETVESMKKETWEMFYKMHPDWSSSKRQKVLQKIVDRTMQTEDDEGFVSIPKLETMDAIQTYTLLSEVDEMFSELKKKIEARGGRL